MSRLFRRYWQLQIGPTRVDGFAAQFDVTKSLDREPNTLAMKIANLSSSTRDRLREPGAQVSVIAGYEDLHDTIFVGDVRDVWSSRDRADIWLEIEAEDGGASYRTATIEKSWTEPVSVGDVIAECATALSVGQGNLRNIAPSASLESGGDIYPEGIVLAGTAWRVLDRVCRDAGLRWSVQNGNLQLRAAGQPAETRAIRLSGRSGLLESPKRSKRDERTGRVTVTAKALMMPGFYPGRVVVLDSDLVSGGWLIQKVRYLGDTRGKDWFSLLELEEY